MDPSTEFVIVHYTSAQQQQSDLGILFSWSLGQLPGHRCDGLSANRRKKRKDSGYNLLSVEFENVLVKAALTGPNRTEQYLAFTGSFVSKPRKMIEQSAKSAVALRSYAELYRLKRHKMFCTGPPGLETSQKWLTRRWLNESINTIERSYFRFIFSIHVQFALWHLNTIVRFCWRQARALPKTT